MNTYVIHATCHYVIKSKETGQTESGQSRPTISVKATSESVAIRKATKQMRERYAAAWPVVSFALIPELVNVIEHPTKPQLRVLHRLAEGRHTGANRAMLRRLVDKGWVEGSMKAGYKLTGAGRREAAR